MRHLLLCLLTLLLLATAPQPVDAQPPTQAQLDRAIKNAVYGLKGIQEPTGLFSYDADDSEKNIGSTALAALALLEAGLPANDPVIVKAAAAVRARTGQLTEVYSISLALLLLDRLGDAGQVRTLAGKLRAGVADGAWSYKCVGGGGTDVPDNSNTQFAIFALWVARKHNVAVEPALYAADERFRRTQRPDGSWSYAADHDRSMPTMTCAGLLGLALGYGASKDKTGYLDSISRGAREISADPAIVAGLSFLEKHVGNDPSDHPQFLYYLWSLSRVCLALRVKTIGQTDWYEWGSEKLLEKQLRDGNWRMKYGPAIDTSFALLFLVRSDQVGDVRRGMAPQLATDRSGPHPAANKSPAEKPEPPPPDTEDSIRLAVKLVRAEGLARDALVKQYRDARGVEYTLALATAIPDLPQERQTHVRAALATRLGRMSTRTLREYLRDEDHEIRRAAAVACQGKKIRELVPDLIRLLRDSGEGVAEAAHIALQNTTGQSFTREASHWEVWWKANSDIDQE